MTISLWFQINRLIYFTHPTIFERNLISKKILLDQILYQKHTYTHTHAHNPMFVYIDYIVYTRTL